MTKVTLSDQAAAIYEIAANIDLLDKQMKIKADELLALLHKKDSLTVALKALANNLR